MELSIVAVNQGALLKVKYAFDLDCWLFFFRGGGGGSIAKKESHMYIHETKISILHNIKTSSIRFCVISDTCILYCPQKFSQSSIRKRRNRFVKTTYKTLLGTTIFVLKYHNNHICTLILWNIFFHILDLM